MELKAAGKKTSVNAAGLDRAQDDVKLSFTRTTIHSINDCYFHNASH